MLKGIEIGTPKRGLRHPYCQTVKVPAMVSPPNHRLEVFMKLCTAYHLASKVSSLVGDAVAFCPTVQRMTVTLSDAGMAEGLNSCAPSLGHQFTHEILVEIEG